MSLADSGPSIESLSVSVDRDPLVGVMVFIGGRPTAIYLITIYFPMKILVKIILMMILLVM